MTTWVKVTAYPNQPIKDWSNLASVFEDFGCPSTIISDSPASLSGYLVDSADNQSRVADLVSSLEQSWDCRTDVEPYTDQDWVQKWKSEFKSIRVGRRLLIKPSWDETPYPEDLTTITLDPGLAFGTGDHPTTRLCLELIEECVTPQMRVFDLGCGSGILGIACRKLGVEQVFCADIDPVATEVTSENALINGLNLQVFCGDGFQHEESRQPWDLIVSNIISATLIRLTPEVACHLNDGGVWILSGVIQDNWESVLARAKSFGFGLVEKRVEGEWVAAKLIKNPL